MLRIFLISLLIIGCFSNFARNKWGFELRFFAEMCLGISFLVEFFYTMVKKDLNRTKRDRIFLQIERVCIAIFFIAFVLKSLHWPAGLFYVLSMEMLVFILCFRLIENYTRHLENRNKKLIFWLFFLFIFIFLSITYYNDLLEDSPGEEMAVLIVSLIFSFITSAVSLVFVLHLISLFIQRNKSTVQNFVTHLFLLSTLLTTSGIQFKTMHWPLSNVIVLIGLIGFLLTLILALSNKIVENNSNKNLFSYYAARFPMVRFAFLYFGIWSIYVMLAIFNFAPRFNSTEYPYVHAEFLEAADHERADKLVDNYRNLIEEIHHKTDSEKH